MAEIQQLLQRVMSHKKATSRKKELQIIQVVTSCPGLMRHRYLIIRT